MTGSTPAKRYNWWHAAGVGALANIAGALPAGYSGDESYYESLRTPPGAPPGWIFAPVWAANNAATLFSNLRIANLPVTTPLRRQALVAEAAHWALFSSFSALYFGLRSPRLGAVDTVASLLVTGYSVRVTTRLDKRAAWALVPRLVWLGYASYVGTATAINGPDAVLSRINRASRKR